MESAGGEDAIIAAFQASGDPLPLKDCWDCFAAQLPRILLRMLRACLPLVASNPPRPSTHHFNNQAPPTLQPVMYVENLALTGGANSGNGTGVDVGRAFSEALYALSASTVDLLGTLAGHGAAIDTVGRGQAHVFPPQAVEGAGRKGVGGDTGGARWVKEIAVGVAGPEGGVGGYGWGGRGKGGRGMGLDMLEACWAVARDVDGIQGESRSCNDDECA